VLRRYQDRPICGYRFVQQGIKDRNGVRWALVPVEGAAAMPLPEVKAVATVTSSSATKKAEVSSLLPYMAPRPGEPPFLTSEQLVEIFRAHLPLGAEINIIGRVGPTGEVLFDKGSEGIDWQAPTDLSSCDEVL
jgi:hypothetical protein